MKQTISIHCLSFSGFRVQVIQIVDYCACQIIMYISPSLTFLDLLRPIKFSDFYQSPEVQGPCDLIWCNFLLSFSFLLNRLFGNYWRRSHRTPRDHLWDFWCEILCDIPMWSHTRPALVVMPSTPPATGVKFFNLLQVTG